MSFLRPRKSPPPANRDLEKDEIIEFLIGPPGGDDAESAFESDQERREAWLAHRGRFLSHKPAHIDAYWGEERYG